MGFIANILGYRTPGGIATPGDPLWDDINRSGLQEPYGIRLLANHWAVKSVTGHIARAIYGVEVVTVAFEPGQGLVPPSDQRGAAIILPHVKRIALDVTRFGEFVAVIAKDRSGTPTELVPLPVDEVSIEYEAGVAAKYSIGDANYSPDRIFHVCEETPACSPLESVRGILMEDILASMWRQNAWKHSPRGIVKRGIESPEWSAKARQRFESSFGNSLKTQFAPVLEDSMDFMNVPLPDAAAGQFIESRRLTAELVGDLYGVQGSLLATGNDRQLVPARKQLLSGPVADVARLISHAYTEQLSVPMYGINGAKITVHFDIEEAKRREDEDAVTTIAAVGGPWRTPDEQRAKEGMKPIGANTLYPPKASAGG